MIKRKYIIILMICLITIVVFIGLARFTVGAFKLPRYSESIYYSSPNWMSNERIIYVKKISHYSHHSDFLAQLSNGTVILEKAEFQICTMDTEGGNEKILRSIRVNYRKFPGYKEKDKIFRFKIKNIGYLAYHPIKNQIVFSAAYDTFAMDKDGSNLRCIIKDGVAVDFSPDETTVIYSPVYYKIYIAPKVTRKVIDKYREIEFWVMDFETGEKWQFPEFVKSPRWYSSGEKILYLTQKIRDSRSRKFYIMNLDGTGKEEFFTNKFPEDWSSDGNKIIFHRSIYDVKTKTYLKVDNISSRLGGVYFSPDATKIVGFVYGGDICLLNSDGTGYRLLKDHRK